MPVNPKLKEVLVKITAEVSRVLIETIVNRKSKTRRSHDKSKRKPR